MKQKILQVNKEIVRYLYSQSKLFLKFVVALVGLNEPTRQETFQLAPKKSDVNTKEVVTIYLETNNKTARIFYY